MDPGDIGTLLILLILLYLSSFFSAAETALTAVNRHRLRALAEDGDSRAQLVLDILDDQNRMLSTILIGNNIVNLSASSLTTVLTAKLGGNLAVGIGTGVLTLAILIFGEIGPKTISNLRAEKVSLRMAPAVRFCMIVLRPLVVLINLLSGAYLFVRRVDPNEKEDAMTEDELRTVVEVSHEEGVIESEEKEMINNVVDLGDSQAKDVMVPRVDVVFVDVNATYEELLECFEGERFTRMPVYEDNRDNIIGVINMKDLVLYRHDRPFSVRDFLRDATFTHEFKSTYELFHEMRKESAQMAIVLDEYGSVVGLVTMEDILEEIVGEIRDEFDESELQELQQVNDREYLVEGSYRIDDLNDVLGTELTSEDYDSIGGYMVGLLDHIPEQGEEVTTDDGFRFVADTVDRNRIEEVRIFLPEDFGKKREEKEPEDAAGDSDKK